MDTFGGNALQDTAKSSPKPPLAPGKPGGFMIPQVLTKLHRPVCFLHFQRGSPLDGLL